jgi:hypothetical protein
VRYRLNAIGRAAAWLHGEPDRSWVEAVGEWLLKKLCDPDEPIDSYTVETFDGDAEATELPNLGVTVLWRLQGFKNRMDVLDIEPFDPDETD